MYFTLNVNPEMAAIFCCGFECGQLDTIGGTGGQHWGQTGGANIVTSPVKSGDRALRVTPAGTTVGAVATIANTSVVVMRFYVRFATLPTANSFIAMPQFNASTACIFRASDNTLTTYCNGTYGTTGIVVTTGVWYRVDFRAVYSSPNVTVDMQVDGTAATTIVVNPGAAQATQFVRMGTTSATTYDAYFDDVIISITSGDYPFGAGKVEHFVPIGDGVHNVAGANDFERSNSGTDITNATTTAFQLVDDVPLKSGTPTEYINLIAPPNATDYVELVFGPAPGISTPTTAPRAVQVIVATAASAIGTNNIRVALNDNGTTDDVCNGSFHASSASIIYQTKQYTDPPSAASAWTVVSGNGNFNNLRIRCYTNDATPDPWLASVMVEAEFVVAGAINVEPGVGALTMSGLAPTVVASDHISVTPDVGALSVTGIEPTALVDTLVTPGVGALDVTGLEPTVTTTQNQNIEVPAGALDLTGLEPTVTASDHQNVQPGVGDLSLTGLEPTAVASDHISVAPDVGVLSLTGLEPSVAISDNQNVAPGVGDLTLTGLEPSVTVSDNQNVQPDVGALTLTGLEPIANLTDNQLVEPGVGALLLTGLEPTAVASDHISVTPGVGDLTLSGLEPTADVTADQFAAPGVGELELAGLEPTVVASDHQNVEPGVGDLTLSGLAPNISVSDNQSVEPGVGVLSLSGLEPTVQVAVNVTPDVGALTLTGFPPSVDITNHISVEPGVGVLTLDGFSPTASGGGAEIEPGVGQLLVTGFEPSVVAINPVNVTPGFGILRVDGFTPLLFVGPTGDLSVQAGSRERLRVFFRQRQLVNESGNVVVQCQGDNSAIYVPGNVDQTWNEFTGLVAGLDKLDLSWDSVNNGKSGESTDTNPAGSNYDKGISASVTLNDEAYQFVYNILEADPCGMLNSVEVMITDELCQKRFRTFEIKADNLNSSPFAAPCEYEVKLREADPVWHCIHKTFIWDNWQNWFLDGSTKQHPCFLTAVESRPRLLSSARMGLSIFGRTIPIFSAIFNENDNAFRRIQNVDNFVDAPLIRDIITNVADKCGMSIDTMFHDEANEYYNLCLYNPSSGAVHVSDTSAVTSPALSFHFENRWNITLAELLDKLKVVFKAEWYVTPNNTLVFKPKSDFVDEQLAAPIIDFTLPESEELWDKYSLNYTFNGQKKPAYGRYQYNIDASDLATQEAAPLYNDIIDFDGPANNLMLEGNLSQTSEFAPTGAVRDGRAKMDYLRETVSEGETVAYAMIVLLAVVIAALFAGVVSAGAATALAAFLGIWVAAIASKANSLRTLFGSATYSGAVRLTSEQVAAPRLLVWDGVSLNRAKMVQVDPDDIDPNLYYNPTAEAYDVRNKFQYAPTQISNYPMFYEAYFVGNLYDRFHEKLDNPMKSMTSHQDFEFDAHLCCELMDIFGLWEDQFAKIGYFVKLESREGYDIFGRIGRINPNYDEETIKISGQLYKIKT